MNYSISYSPHHQHFIDICLSVVSSASKLRVQCPAWRPGRYEIGNFSRNIRGWRACNEQGKELNYQKLTKDLWEVDAGKSKEVHIYYSYYAAELNAGSTYLDNNQLYMNPVNCCMYIQELRNEPTQLQLILPENYKVATSLKSNEPILEGIFKRHIFHSAGYDELADSPIIASASLQHNYFDITVNSGKENNRIRFNLWFHGEIKPNWHNLLKDFQIFTREQVKMMTSMPVKEYHFLFQVLPYKYHHGVEHLASTVIAIGPSCNMMKSESYNDLLGLSCHELFHCWNIKSIRPQEMFPYDYTRENYSRLGYVYEGVTTYYGDYLLFRAGIFNETEYFKALCEEVQKHFDNYGRYNLSIAASSFDTWLDGYTSGIPHRKVSIYAEGSLLALITDVFIRKGSRNRKSLDDVMRILYKDYAEKNKPYTEREYWKIVSDLAGTSCEDIFNYYVNKPADLEIALSESLDYIGLSLHTTASKRFCERYWGLKAVEEEGRYKITAIAPGSPAEVAGINVNDEIAFINGHPVKQYFHDWCEYYGHAEVCLTLLPEHVSRQVAINSSKGKEFFPMYNISKLKDATPKQKEAFKAWSRKKF